MLDWETVVSEASPAQAVCSVSPWLEAISLEDSATASGPPQRARRTIFYKIL